jgi:O-antigen ligase
MILFKIKYLEYLQLSIILLLPILLITGPFLTDLSVSLSGIMLIIFYFRLKNKIYFKNLNIIFLFILWCIYILFSSLNSDNILLSLESSLFYFRFGFLVLVIYFCCSNYEDFIKLFLLILSLCFIILFIDSCIQYLTNYNIFGWKTVTPGRISSFFKDELVMGSYVSRLLPTLVGLFLISFYNTKSHKLFLFLIIILFFANVLVFLSGERASLFNIIAFNIFAIIFSKALRKIFMINFLLFFIISLFVTFSDNTIKQRLYSQTLENFNIFQTQKLDNQDKKKLNNEKYVFSSIHQVTYLSALEIFKDNFIIGVGPKNYREVCHNIEYKHYFEKGNECLSHPHNTYIQLLSETGIIGFVSILAIFIIITFKLSKYIFVYSLSKSVENFILESKGFLLFSLFLTLFPFIPTGNFFNNWLSCLYFISIGFLFYINNKEKT